MIFEFPDESFKPSTPGPVYLPVMIHYRMLKTGVDTSASGRAGP